MAAQTDAYRSARDVAADVASRRLSAREAALAAIARIEQADGKLNAVVVRDFERALAAADEADAAIAAGDRRPLLGVPVTVKESYNVAGLPTTWGIPFFKGMLATEDAVAVARLKAAGAIVLGKTNVPFALGDWQSYNDLYGTTNNPWALDRTPGGSSGGSAVSLAAGYVPLEIGSDIGGSLRAPAHYCGVYSHKPSRGVIPGRGHTLPGTIGGNPDLPVVGPLARNVADLELAFNVLEGPDIIEAVATRTLPPPRHERLADYRVLIIDTHPVLPADTAMRGALARLGERLRASGVKVETESPLVPDLNALAKAFAGLIMPVISARQPPAAQAAAIARAAELKPDDDSPYAWAVRGAVATHREWIMADEVRTRAAYQWFRLFKEFDVVLFPPMPTPAFVQDQSEMYERTISIDGEPYPYGGQLYYASLATPPWLPATTAPIEISAGGLPIGVQIIGPYFEDRTTIRFAALMEAAFGGFVPPPDYA